MSNKDKEVKKELETKLELEVINRQRHNSASERIKQRHELQHLYIEKKREGVPLDDKPKHKKRGRYNTY